MIGHPPPCPACGDPMPHPGAGQRCPAVTDRTNMVTCSALFCGPDCACPVVYRPPQGRSGPRGFQPGRWEHDWAARDARLNRLVARVKELR